jgi:hypothetical protein
MTWPTFSSLQSFWPGMQVLWGDVARAERTQRQFYELWRAFGLLPERFMLNTGSIQEGHVGYPLRPELIESLFYLHRATNSSEWLEMGRDVLSGLLASTWVPCGHAAVSSVKSHERSDHMNSYFLAETAKYLYLLFDYTGSPTPRSTAGEGAGMDITPVLPDDAVEFSAAEREMRQAYMRCLEPAECGRQGGPSPVASRGGEQGFEFGEGYLGTGVRGVKVEAAFGLPPNLQALLNPPPPPPPEEQAVAGVAPGAAGSWPHGPHVDVSRDYIFTTEGHMIPLRVAQGWNKARRAHGEEINMTAVGPLHEVYSHNGGEFHLRRSCDVPKPAYVGRGIARRPAALRLIMRTTPHTRRLLPRFGA